MNVKQLMDALAELPDDMEVIIQKDGEGNDFSPLSDVDSESVYIPYSEWSGDAYSVYWSADDADMSEEEWAKVLAMPRALILCPVD
jgi:hypothetical protein